MASLAQIITQELLEGRPKDKPISPLEMVGLIRQIDPELPANQKVMSGLNAFMGMWNKQAQEHRDMAFKQAEAAWKSGTHLGLAAPPDLRQSMQQQGFYMRDPGAPLASPGGFMSSVMGQGQPGQMMQAGQMAQPVSQKKGLKQTAFPGGVIPSKGMLAAENTRMETPALAERAEQTAFANTKGQRQAGQLFPQARWVTRHMGDGSTQDIWSEDARRVDRGKPLPTVQDQRAEIMRKALTNTGLLNPEEKKYWEQVMMRNPDMDVFMALLSGASRPALNQPQATQATQGQGGQGGPHNSNINTMPESVSGAIPPRPHSPGQRITPEVIQQFTAIETGGGRPPTKEEMQRSTATRQRRGLERGLMSNQTYWGEDPSPS
jgi:hypothetical protein